MTACLARVQTRRRASWYLSASSTPPKIHVWDAMQIIRDPYSGAGAGKVTAHRDGACQSPLYVPHGTSQVKEVHPKISARRALSVSLRIVQSSGLPGDLLRQMI